VQQSQGVSITNHADIPHLNPDNMRHPAVANRRIPCAHELIETQVERTPEAAAVIAHGDFVSYRELNRRANILARNLREIGIRPEARVGIYADKSIGMIVGLLATLKAGGAYVPLDRANPVRRPTGLPLSAVITEGSLPSPRASLGHLRLAWMRTGAIPARHIVI
jgi:non-ribosomal peptide synthetase component F